LQKIETEQKFDLTTFPQDIATPLAELAKVLSARDEADLAITVKFSVQASESMAAVSRITREVREIDTNAQEDSVCAG